MDGAAPEKSSPEKPLSGCSLAELEAQITELAGQLNAANYRWLTLIGEFDRRQGWADGSLQSCAHWLNFKVGLNLGAAREKVRVAHALAGVPKSTPPPMPRATFPRKRRIGAQGTHRILPSITKCRHPHGTQSLCFVALRVGQTVRGGLALIAFECQLAIW